MPSNAPSNLSDSTLAGNKQVEQKKSPFVLAAIADVKSWFNQFQEVVQKIHALSKLAQPLVVQELASFCVSPIVQQWISSVYNGRFQLIESLNREFTAMLAYIGADINGFVVSADTIKAPAVQAQALIAKLSKQALDIGRRKFDTSEAHFPINIVVGPSGCGKHMIISHFEKFMSFNSPLVNPDKKAQQLVIRRWSLDELDVINVNNIIISINTLLLSMDSGLSLGERLCGLPQCLVIEKLDQIFDSHILTTAECASLCQSIVSLLHTHTSAEVGTRRLALRPMIFITMNAVDSFIGRRFCRNIKDKFGKHAISYEFGRNQPTVPARRQWMMKIIQPKFALLHQTGPKVDGHDPCIQSIQEKFSFLTRKLALGADIKMALDRSLDMPFADRITLGTWLHELNWQSVPPATPPNGELVSHTQPSNEASQLTAFNFKQAMWSVVISKTRFFLPSNQVQMSNSVFKSRSTMTTQPTLPLSPDLKADASTRRLHFIPLNVRLKLESFWSQFFAHVPPSSLLHHVLPMTAYVDFQSHKDQSDLSFPAMEYASFLSDLACLIHHPDLFASSFDEVKEMYTSAMMDAMFGVDHPLVPTTSNMDAYNFSVSSTSNVTEGYWSSIPGIPPIRLSPWSYAWERETYRGLPYTKEVVGCLESNDRVNNEPIKEEQTQGNTLLLETINSRLH
jgi:hypothetical protein